MYIGRGPLKAGGIKAGRVRDHTGRAPYGAATRFFKRGAHTRTTTPRPENL